MAGHQHHAENARKHREGNGDFREKPKPLEFVKGHKVSEKSIENSRAATEMRKSITEWMKTMRDEKIRLDDGSEVCMGAALAMSLYRQALSGDVRASELILRAQGELEGQTFNLNLIPRLVDDIK